MTALSPHGPAPMESNPLLKPLDLTPREFLTVTALARERLGIELGAGKEQLVAARIGKIMRRNGFARFREYYAHLQADHTGEALVQLLDALTTNHTSFFREQAHFDFLVEHIFREWSGSRPIRIWSAASSTGEEPYSIAMTAREFVGGGERSVPAIVASDISTHALSTARKGVYRSDRIEPALAPWMRKHLLRGEGEWQGWYRMHPEVMAMVEFRRINLIEPFPQIGRFHVIFCRNVMIYFSHATQEKLVNQLAESLELGGYLFVGHSETLTGIHHGLQQIQAAIYRKRGATR